jgi:tetratricopeptide (TPR) repeat protein
MQPRLSHWLAALVLGGASVLGHAHEGDDLPAGKPGEQLGKVVFHVECSPAAQREFNRAIALYHSFWFDPATESFRKVLELDPGCGMGWWGQALSALANPFGWPAPAKAMQTGAAAIEQGLKTGARTQRERDYIAALAKLFQDWDKTDHRPRALAWEAAMEQVAQRYPDDNEAQIFYALSLVANALASDKTFARQLKAGGILEPYFQSHPDHPGAAHYLIHAYDYTELVQRGLPAARRYASIAPSAPHALHMPAHIFTRLGLWEDSIVTNSASARAAKAELRSASHTLGSYNAVHAMDYMVYAHLQLGQDAAARRLIDEMAAVERVDATNFAAAYGFAAMPARYALERRRWDEAARLELHPKSLPWNQFPHAEAIVVYTRALAKARLDDVHGARDDIARLQQLRDALAAMKLAYWVQQTEIQIAAASAWLALAEEREGDALGLMRQATEMEAATDKHPVTPGPLVPTRELLGEMLLEVGQPAQALAEFERLERAEPNRLLPLYNAARAAEATGDTAKAQAYYRKLLDLTAKRDTERPEIARARAHVALN